MERGRAGQAFIPRSPAALIRDVWPDIFCGAETEGGTAIRYTIEYFAGIEAKPLVCSTVFSDASLAAAILTARAGANLARTQHRANGFQIRDELQGSRIVASEGFWGFAA